MKIRVTILLISVFLLTANFGTAQDNAKAIFLKATEILTTENVEMAMSIDVTDDKGHLKEKALTVLMAKFGDEKLTKVIWQKPERAKGITIIISEPKGETGTIEVSTPSNGKTRKLRATDSNMKMMGAEFSMTSFANYNPAKLKYEMLSDTTINGKSCNQIRVSQTDVKDHSGAVLAIRKDSNLIVKATRFDGNNKTLSRTQLSDYKNIDGDANKMYPMHIVTKDYANNQDIDIHITNAKVRKDVAKSDFTL